MKQCPKCKKWTLEFDDYFGRFRCFNPDCEWMPSSSTERQIRLLDSHQEPEIIDISRIPELNLPVVVTYDSLNDVLGFDFGMRESTFDLPQPDGRIVWKVSHRTGDVVGFEILEARKLGVSEVRVNIAARKEDIEKYLKKLLPTFLTGRPSRMLITGVAVRVESEEPQSPCPTFKEAVERFESAFR